MNVYCLLLITNANKWVDSINIFKKENPVSFMLYLFYRTVWSVNTLPTCNL